MPPYIVKKSWNVRQPPMTKTRHKKSINLVMFSVRLSILSIVQQGTKERDCRFPKRLCFYRCPLVSWLVWPYFNETGMDDGSLLRIDPIDCCCFPDKGKDPGTLRDGRFSTLLLISQGIMHESWRKMLGILWWLAISEWVQFEVEPIFDDRKSLLSNYYMLVENLQGYKVWYWSWLDWIKTIVQHWQRYVLCLVLFP